MLDILSVIKTAPQPWILKFFIEEKLDQSTVILKYLDETVVDAWL